MTREQAAIEQAFFVLQRIQAGDLSEMCDCQRSQIGEHRGEPECPVTIGLNTAINVLRAKLQPETPAPSWQHQVLVLPTLESEKCRHRDGGHCSNWAEYSDGKTLRRAQHIPSPQVMLDEHWIMLPQRYAGPATFSVSTLRRHLDILREMSADPAIIQLAEQLLAEREPEPRPPQETP